MTAPDPERYYSPPDLAAAYGLDEPLVRRWLAEGLKHIERRRRGKGAEVLVKGAWLAEYAEAQGVVRRPAEPEAAGQPKAKGKPRRPARGEGGRIVLR